MKQRGVVRGSFLSVFTFARWLEARLAPSCPYRAVVDFEIPPIEPEACDRFGLCDY